MSYISCHTASLVGMAIVSTAIAVFLSNAVMFEMLAIPLFQSNSNTNAGTIESVPSNFLESNRKDVVATVTRWLFLDGSSKSKDETILVEPQESDSVTIESVAGFKNINHLFESEAVEDLFLPWDPPPRKLRPVSAKNAEFEFQELLDFLIAREDFSESEKLHLCIDGVLPSECDGSKSKSKSKGKGSKSSGKSAKSWGKGKGNDGKGSSSKGKGKGSVSKGKGGNSLEATGKGGAKGGNGSKSKFRNDLFEASPSNDEEDPPSNDYGQDGGKGSSSKAKDGNKGGSKSKTKGMRSNMMRRGMMMRGRMMMRGGSKSGTKGRRGTKSGSKGRSKRGGKSGTKGKSSERLLISRELHSDHVSVVQTKTNTVNKKTFISS